MNRARKEWRARYRATRIAGVPSVWRHGSLIRAEAARLRSIGSLADVDAAERGALANVAEWHGRNAARALGRFTDPASVAEALNLAADARRRGSLAMAQMCVRAARTYRVKSEAGQ